MKEEKVLDTTSSQEVVSKSRSRPVLLVRSTKHLSKSEFLN